MLYYYIAPLFWLRMVSVLI